MAIKLGGGGGSASQFNEIVSLNDSADTVTLSDGRVYLKGGVFETDVNEYPLATKSYNNISNFSVGSQSALPYAIEWDGTFFWVLQYNGPIYKYNASGVYQNSTWTTASQATNTRGLVWDGTHFWVLNFGGTVYKYNASGTYQNVDWTAAAQTSDVKDMVWDGTSFWVVDVSLKKAFKYNSSGVYQNVSFNLYGGETACYGLTWDGSSLFAIGYALDAVYKYSLITGVVSNTTLGGQNYVRVA